MSTPLKRDESAEDSRRKTHTGTVRVCPRCGHEHRFRYVPVSVLDRREELLAEALGILVAFKETAEEARGHYGIEQCAGVAQPDTEWDEIQKALATLASDATDLLRRTAR